MALRKSLGKGLAAVAARIPNVSRAASAARSAAKTAVKRATRAGSTFVTTPLKPSGRAAGATKAAGSRATTKTASKGATKAASKSATKSAVKRTTSRAGAPQGKRERIDTTPGKAGGSRYVRRDSEGHFTKDQVSVGKSLAADRRTKASTKATKGNKDRGD